MTDRAPFVRKQPTNIRRNTHSYTDPYIDDESLQDNSVCMRCGAVYASGRWYLEGEVPPEKLVGDAPVETLCPGCQKLRDKMPGGVLKITGAFVQEHNKEIMNLIYNESAKARATNPLERVMGLEEIDGGMEITTTNEKLAQRLGRALYKAYSGSVEYKWSQDNKLARVNWHRDS